MSQSQKHQTTLNSYKTIATHSLAVAIFTNIWVIAVLSDLLGIITGTTTSGTIDPTTGYLKTISLISSVALAIGLLAYGVYFYKKKRA